MARDLVSLLTPRRASAGPQNKAPVPYVGRQQSTGGMGTWLGGGRGRGDDLDAMGENGTLYGIISRLADAVSSIEWHMHDPAAGGKCEVCGEVGVMLAPDYATDPMFKLWTSPNPFFYGALHRETIEQHIDLTGENYQVVVSLLGVPTELWSVRPDRMTPVPDRENYLLGWIYTGPDGERIPLLHEQVLQARTPDPNDSYRGMGPLGALAPALSAARLAQRWAEKFYENNALPGGLIEFEEPMNDTQYRQFVERWREAHQGINNAHRVGIIEGGKWVDRKFTQKDMQFTEGQTLTASQIREAYGFPEFAQGIVKDLNRATAEASDDFFAAWLAVPRARRMRDVLNHRLPPMFGTMARPGRTFAFKSPVDGDVEAAAKVLGLKSTAFATLVGAGVDGPDAMDAAGLPQMQWKRIEPKVPAALPAGGRPGPPADAAPAIEQAPVRGWLGRVIDGWVVENADTPPYLQRIQDDWTRALDALVADWQSEVTPEMDRALLAGVESALGAGDPVRLAVLDMQIDLQPAVTMLEQAMTAMSLRAGTRVAEEAAAHGVDVAPIMPRDSTHHGIVNITADMGTVAAATAALLATGYAQAVGNEALRWVGSGRTVEQIVEKVRNFVGKLTVSGLRTRLGGLLTRAQNAGRIATLAAAPVERWFANERLDGNTCDPCKKINGKRLPTTEAMILAYGGGGGYLFCEGRERCRGFPDAVWSNDE